MQTADGSLPWACKLFLTARPPENGTSIDCEDFF
jgi:hypothetical protein